MLHKFLLGLPMGIANTLPGISGGTIALILGVYDELLEAVKKLDWKHLLPIGAGIATGILSTSFITTYLLEHYPNEVYGFLFGLIVVSTLILIKREKTYTSQSFLWLILGVLISNFMTNIEMGVQWKTLQFPLFFLGGFIATGAMILPGISGATTLVLLGIYEEVLHAVTVFDLKVLLPFGAGALLGFSVFAGIISFLLTRQRHRTMSFIVGLVLGSLPILWPEWSVLGFIMALIGGVAAYFLREQKK